MTSPVFSAGLELREEGDGTRRLRGSFPYRKRAVIDSGGNGRRPRKEQFASRAFSFAVEDTERDIHLLIGHSFDRPLASRKAGTLSFTDSDDALTFEAVLTREIQRTTWGQDFLAAYAAGLITGLSPGFRVAPPEAVPRPEETVDEDPAEGNALIRTIFAAVLFEMSLVTRPAYPDTEADLRSFNPAPAAPHPMTDIMRRWRL
ncbi:HK97 family phage prohead protease [Erythrobacter rubeus]|uniref:HK97 family phage prohead protease n=1 Tax=Erythrobacter rubeus TaxID=2760803 RepID=A0ABR8KKI7_9SPHN|nr:HK97 family phage prohead protease [Erythrobacter rubeus]MBD2840767.1 HK97 family phage prohead protease [Erythrobacter rubeus]